MGKKTIDKKAKVGFKDETVYEGETVCEDGIVYEDGKMLVGYDLFKYVFDKKMRREERERDFGIEPSPYDCGI